MKKIFITYLTAVFLLVTACEKARGRVDDFFVEFATVLKPGGQKIHFQLDNNKLLVPINLKNYSGEIGQRLVLNYTPLRGDTVRVNSVSDIFTGRLRESDNVAQIVRNPVKIQSVWVGGNWLNLILETEYNSKKHIAGLFRDTKSASIDLYFEYSRENDLPGYAKKFYASFSLADLKSADGSPTPFRVHINTLDGERVFELEAK